eukprot:365698-Chlamydomonas_euryale.AAC.2
MRRPQCHTRDAHAAPTVSHPWRPCGAHSVRASTHYQHPGYCPCILHSSSRGPVVVARTSSLTLSFLTLSSLTLSFLTLAFLAQMTPRTHGTSSADLYTQAGCVLPGARSAIHRCPKPARRALPPLGLPTGRSGKAGHADGAPPAHTPRARGRGRYAALAAKRCGRMWLSFSPAGASSVPRRRNTRSASAGQINAGRSNEGHHGTRCFRAQLCRTTGPART